MGTDRGLEDERPPHRVFVDRFELAVFPVTPMEYACFADATRREPPRACSDYETELRNVTNTTSTR